MGGWFLGKFLLSIITSLVFEQESCATSQIVDLEKLLPKYTVGRNFPKNHSLIAWEQGGGGGV